jgi:hypothetical protein
MRQSTKLACAMLLSSCLFSVNYSCLNAQVNSVQASSEDTKAIEAILHSNPSDHVTEDVSITNIFGTVRSGRAEFVKRHIEIGNTIFKGTTVKSSIAKLRLIRPDVAIADVSGEMNGFPTPPPAGVPVGADGVLRFKLLMVLISRASSGDIPRRSKSSVRRVRCDSTWRARSSSACLFARRLRNLATILLQGAMVTVPLRAAFQQRLPSGASVRFPLRIQVNKDYHLNVKWKP